jgi:nicotinate-nucleotide pyrophosphorylase (carboxylating)
MNWVLLDDKITSWLKEDMNYCDITTDSLVSSDSVSSGEFLAKKEGVIAGLEVMRRVFFKLDPSVEVQCTVCDGDKVKAGQIIALINGNTRSILKGERLALNLLQRLSGIATKTSAYVDLVKDLGTRIVDTRKTTPGMRELEKYAVRMGGGHNHRFNLSDAVLIKDNHIAACGSIKEAVKRAKDRVSHTTKIEVEVEDLSQLEEALEAGAHIIMLDNMAIETMKEAVRITNGRAVLEASGNINLSTVRGVAETGVDLISVGAITHSAKALDISLTLKE